MSSNVRPLRRRSKRSLAARMRTFWIVGVLLVVALCAAAYALLEWPALRPQSVAVEGASRVAHVDVLAAAAIDPQRNAWLIDRAAVSRRVEAIPYVKTVRVTIVPRAHVIIAITEREPWACVLAADGSRGQIDDQLRLLEGDCGLKQEPMFRVADLAALPAPGSFLQRPALRNMTAAYKELAAAGTSLRYYDLDEFGGLLAVRPDGIVVKFGSFDRLTEKARLIEPILNTVRGRLGVIKAVDVRAPSTPVVEYR